MNMHLTFRQIEVFTAVARHENYTRAARSCISASLRCRCRFASSKTASGLPLFEQVGKKIHLTDAGRHMYSVGRQIADVLGEAEEVFEAFKGVERGTLSLSVATTASHFATRLLAEFSKQHAGIIISLDITNREVLRKQLENNEPDLVIMGQPPEGVEVEATAFMENPLVVIASPSHPLAKRKAIPLKRV